MKIYDELLARGLIAQVTDEEEIRELVNNGQATFILASIPQLTLYMLDILWRSA